MYTFTDLLACASLNFKFKAASGNYLNKMRRWGENFPGFEGTSNKKSGIAKEKVKVNRKVGEHTKHKLLGYIFDDHNNNNGNGTDDDDDKGKSM